MAKEKEEENGIEFKTLNDRIDHAILESRRIFLLMLSIMNLQKMPSANYGI